MKLVIDTRDGFAGDISVAGLLSLGANSRKVLDVVSYAAHLLGKAKITSTVVDGAEQLQIVLEKNDDHLLESRAKVLLEDALEYGQVNENYRLMARNVLDVLCRAERHVHATYEQLRHMHKGDEAVLHEAQDILVDIVGFVMGLQVLNVVEVCYLDFVNVGNGKIKFSHGVLDVPAPATKHILETRHFVWRKSDEFSCEMCTPTGASILAGAGATRVNEVTKVARSGMARGTKAGLPSVRMFLVE